MTDQQGEKKIDENKLDENKLIAERRAKLDSLREQGGVAFPNSFRPADTAGDLQANFGEKTKEELEQLARPTSIAGRVIRNRGAFIVIQDSSGTIQLYVTKEARSFAKSLDLGDILGISGALHKSGKGDLYVQMDDYQLLTKALRPLPDKFHGLADQEMRYRQRYVDLIVNPKVRETFITRSRVVDFIRSYLNIFQSFGYLLGFSFNYTSFSYLINNSWKSIFIESFHFSVF